jgi:pimeloyl-CoA dehydrogenase
VLLAGSEAQQKDWLEGVVAGEKLLALAQQERGSRFDLHRVATRAEASGEDFRIHGEKVAVLDGAAADAIVVVARTAGAEDEEAGITLFLVPAGTPGLRVERQSRVDSRGAALVRLDGCEVGRDAVLGRVGEAASTTSSATGSGARRGSSTPSACTTTGWRRAGWRSTRRRSWWRWRTTDPG